MRVIFYHPHGSLTYEADVDANTTGETCIRNLVDTKFIEKPTSAKPYALQVTRTGKQILLSTTMQEVGVADGDSINVLQMEQGAQC